MTAAMMKELRMPSDRKYYGDHKDEAGENIVLQVGDHHLDLFLNCPR